MHNTMSSVGGHGPVDTIEMSSMEANTPMDARMAKLNIDETIKASEHTI